MAVISNPQMQCDRCGKKEHFGEFSTPDNDGTAGYWSRVEIDVADKRGRFWEEDKKRTLDFCESCTQDVETSRRRSRPCAPGRG
jgi:hypothetical protein